MNMSFKDKVLPLITVPVEKVIHRPVEGLDCVAVYFYGKARPAYIFNDPESEWDDDVATFLYDVRNGSDLMLLEARKMYGDSWPKYIKVRIPASELKTSKTVRFCYPKK